MYTVYDLHCAYPCISHFHNPNVKSEAKIHGYVPSNESAQIVILDKLKITNQAEFRGGENLAPKSGKKELVFKSI